MNVAYLAAAGLILWTALAFTLGPVIGSAISGRPLDHQAREAVAWGGVGILMGLFLIVFLLVGTQP
jgi:hypothetical protein